jgi:hypothetical protein
MWGFRLLEDVFFWLLGSREKVFFAFEFIVNFSPQYVQPASP